MDNIVELTRKLARANIAGAVTASDGVADANKLVMTNSEGVIDSSFVIPNAALNDHINDAAVHLSVEQNTFLDALTASATELNYVDGVTSAIQTQLDAKTTELNSHAGNDARHLSVAQNTLLDSLTATATELNYVAGVTSAVQTQLDAKTSALNTHIADATKHLTSAQNTWIDGISASSTEVNHLVGVTGAVQTQLDSKASATDLDAHIANGDLHLSEGQNTLLDGLTPTLTELNYVDGVTSSIQIQLNDRAAALVTHIADASKHLTSSQNTLLDNLTATYTELNYVAGVTSAIQTQLDAKTSALNTHIADATKHLTSSQNTWLDSITASSTEVNYLVGVTSGVQAQLDAKSDSTALATHIADETLHLSEGQNTLLDALTATATELNYSDGVTSSIQDQLNAKTSALNTHIADATKHLTSAQNTLLDAVTVTATEINHLTGVNAALQTQIDAKADSNALSTHIADATKHLTSPQNTWIDAITATAIEVNSLVGVTSTVQTQLDAKALASDLSTHAADATKHLTPSQNTLLDAVTVTAPEINSLSGISGNVQTQLDAKASGTDVSTHIADDDRHLTTEQNTLIDSVTVLAENINTLTGVTANIQTQLDEKASTSTLNTHIADASKHLTSSQNTFLDAVTATATEVNHLSGISANVQTQLDSKAVATDLTTHVADATKHLTTGQNALLDALTVSATELNRVAGVTSGVQTQLDAKASTAALSSATTSLQAYADAKVDNTPDWDNPSQTVAPSQEATLEMIDLFKMSITTYDPAHKHEQILTVGDFATNLEAGNATITDKVITPAALDSVVSQVITDFGVHLADTNNPHEVTKAQVGLSNVDNTSDANKPVSTATQTALDLKQAADDELTKYNKQATNIASASTVDLGAATGAFVQITGNSPITSFGTAAAGVVRRVRFTANPSVAHDGTNIIMPTGASQVMSAGDMFTAISTGTGWRITTFDRASGELEKYCNGAASAASGSAYAIGAATSDLIQVTGTNNISSITGGITGMSRTLVFIGSLTLIHGANLLLPGAANITTAAGDVAVFRAMSSVTWRCVQYLPANGLPFLHASTHKSGGTDAIKLDELAAPTDVTTLNASTGTHGLLPKLDGTTTNFLRGDGSWSLPTVTSVNTQTGDVVISKSTLSLDNVDNTSDVDKPISTATQSALDLKANLTDVVGLLDLKSSIDASANPNYPAALKGDSMFVSAAGRVGGVSGMIVEIGDLLIAVSDNAGGTQASVGSSWSILQNNIQGLTADGLALVQSDYATMRSLLSLVVGTNVQAYRAELGRIGLMATAASASTVSLEALAGDTVTITGTTTITSFGTSSVSGVYRKLIFSSSGGILTHNASTLVLPGSANITIQVGDTAEFVSTSFNKWVCVSYQRGNGNPLTGGGTLWNNYRDEVDKIASGITTVSSASTTNIGAVSTDQMYITGTSTINTLSGGTGGMRRKLYFTSSGGTLSSAAVALPGSNSITWTAGDSAEVVYTGSAPAWKCISYFKANGKALVAPEAGTDFNAYRFELDIINTTSGIGAAGTMEIQGVSGDYLVVYGSASITSLGYGASPYGASRVLVFDESGSVLVNSSAIILPGAADITVAAGDVAIFRQLASDVWKCISYTRADGTALSAPAKADNSDVTTGTDNNKFVTSQGVHLAKAVLPVSNISSTGGAISMTMAGCIINVNFSSDGTVLIPTNSSEPFYIGTQVLFRQTDVGKATITPDTGVTINSVTGTFQTLGQHALCTLIKVGTDEWVLGGALTP